MFKHDKSVSIHVKKFQYLATEIFKVENDHFSEIMKEIFIFHENLTYNVRSGNHLTRRNIRTTHYGIETMSNLGSKIWDLLPEKIKNASSLSVFKTKIKKRIPKKCPCKLCQTYIKNIGLIWLYPIDLQNFAIILLLEFLHHWNRTKLNWFLKLLLKYYHRRIWDCLRNFWDGNLLASADDRKPLTFVTQGFVLDYLQ